jgi:hypothetical protein
MSRLPLFSLPLLLISTLGPIGFASGADWPQWRGPNRDGISPDTGLLSEWPTDGPPLAWKGTGIGHGYSDGKGWVCQEFKTGNTVWEEKQKLGKGSIAYADGHLYLRSESKGTVVLIEATPQAFTEKGRFEQPDRSQEKSWGHPIVIGGRLYLRDQDVLLCYDVKRK